MKRVFSSLRKSDLFRVRGANVKYSKLIVMLIVIMNAVFAMAILYVFLQTSSEPAVLVGAWFAWTTGELWALSKIKCTEKKGQVKEDEKQIDQ